MLDWQLLKHFYIKMKLLKLYNIKKQTLIKQHGKTANYAEIERFPTFLL